MVLLRLTVTPTETSKPGPSCPFIPPHLGDPGSTEGVEDCGYVPTALRVRDI